MVTLSKAINLALHEAMTADRRVVMLGQDIGGLGGVFRVTDGLQKDFGPQRVMDTPIAESGIVGVAIGLALRGYRPVCEIQFDGFVYPAFDQIVSQLAKLRARSRGTLSVPIVIRIPVGGGIGAVEHHSESNEAYFAHTAGLRVVYCSSPHEGHWMLRQAIESDDPVIFFEPKRRYWTKGDIDDTTVLPLDRVRIVRAGRDITVVTYGGMVATCLDAAQAAAGEGREIEVIDLRSLAPIDLPPVVESVSRTGRCLVVHEASTFAGFGAEVAAQVSEACFFALEAPVLRVGGLNLPYPPSKLENVFLPDLDRVLDAVDRSLAA